MSHPSSPYYPPRARWHGSRPRVRYRLRHHLTYRPLHLPEGVPAHQLLAGLAVPGLAVWFRGPRVAGYALMGVALFLMAAGVVWLGQPLGNVALGLLLSLHATSIMYLLEPWLTGTRLRFRVVCSMAVMAFLALSLYMPARQFAQSHWFMPLNVNGRTVVVRVRIPQAAAGLPALRPGDWLAYTLPENYVNGVYIRAGIVLGPVLAGPGACVRFRPTSLEVNGRLSPRLPSMPLQGEFVVPEKCWFVWPQFDIQGHGYVPGADVGAILLRLALVTPEQVLGVPFAHWFWRRQIPA